MSAQLLNRIREQGEEIAEINKRVAMLAKAVDELVTANQRTQKTLTVKSKSDVEIVGN